MKEIIFPKHEAAFKNNRVLNEVFKLFVAHFDSIEDAIEKINFCKRHYFHLEDYNLAQSATIFLPTNEIRTMYNKCGYDTEHWGTSYTEHTYYRAVREIADYICDNQDKIKLWK